MNRQNFLVWVENPSLLDQNSLPDLGQILADYPYFQTARILYTLTLRMLDDHRFDEALRVSAAVVADRARLKEWLDGAQSPVPGPAARLSMDKQLKVRILEDQIKSSLHQIEQNQERLRELLDEKRSLTGDENIMAQPPAEGMRPLPKDALLEEYLREKPGQAAGKVPFFSPEESARRSLEENEGILSETLARLVAAQGKIDRAIKIYQQLMLKNPQKSSYFAAQIEKLINQPKKSE